MSGEANELDDDLLNDSGDDSRDEESGDESSREQSSEDNQVLEDKRQGLQNEDAELEGKTEEQREEIRARRREERRMKKERAREREEEHRRALHVRDEKIAELNSRLDKIDRRNHGFDLANIDSQMQALNAEYIGEQQRIAEATKNQDGAGVAQATDRMLEIREKFNKIAATKEAIVKGQNAPKALDPRLIQHANEWKERNQWYDPEGGDEDSQIALVVDRQLVRDGYNPNTKEYWQELDVRLKKRLPHRAQTATTNTRSQSRGAPVGGSSRSSSIGTRQAGANPALSQERIAALKQAGLWDDPVKREKAIANFKTYDNEHQGE